MMVIGMYYTVVDHVGDIDDHAWSNGRDIFQTSTTHMQLIQASQEEKHVNILKWELRLGYELEER